MTASELEAHYANYGLAEGRAGSAVVGRHDFVALLAGIASILEIGPLANPAVRGANVKYFDVLPTDALKRKARDYGLDATQCPPIDFVSETGGLAVVTELFDAVISCHAVEHHPDLIQHLVGVARILKPHGRYYLAIPDKRFCFDHYVAESTIADVLDASVREVRVHDLSSVIRNFALTTHNDSRRHWEGDHGCPAYKTAPTRIREALTVYLSHPDRYIDSNAWQFTPFSFREILETLSWLDVAPFRILRIYPTVWGSNEFYVVLEKNADDVAPLHDALPDGFDDSLYLRANPDIARAGVDPKHHYLVFGRYEKRKIKP
ncbi:MAG: methyltransferase domain-containing protein [Gemmatimonadaceae bacterium]